MKEITSLQNSEIKNIIKLRKTSKRKKGDLVVVEGRKEIELAVKGGLEIREIYFSKDIVKNENLVEQFNCPTVNTTWEVFEKISIRENPDGFLALIHTKPLSLENVDVKKVSLVVVLEGIEKPGNLGAILRTCDATGVNLVILNNPKTDIYNPNVIRSSLGTIFTNKIVIESTEKTKKWLKTNKITSFATTPSSKKYHFNANFREKVSVIIGTEHEGLSQDWLESAENLIKIPMNGKIDSLNVSVSTAIVLYEVLRQRIT